VQDQTLAQFFEANSSADFQVPWIHELAIEKNHRITRLQTVSFDEDMVHPNGNVIFSLRNWEQPKSIEESFQAAGVSLGVSFRATRVARLS
jgi:hypothetical protein